MQYKQWQALNFTPNKNVLLPIKTTEVAFKSGPYTNTVSCHLNNFCLTMTLTTSELVLGCAKLLVQLLVSTYYNETYNHSHEKIWKKKKKSFLHLNV